MRSLGIITLVSMLSATQSFALSSSIELTDCNGAPRGNYTVESDHYSTLNISVKDLAGKEVDGGEATLTSSVNDALTSEVRLGTAVFDKVAPGSWKLCFHDSQLSLDKVSVVSGEAISEDTTTTLASVGAGIVGVGSILAVSLGGGSSSNDPSAALIEGSADSIDSVTAAGQVSNSRPSSSSTGLGGKGGVSVQGQSSSPCFIGDEVTPMSPFS